MGNEKNGIWLKYPELHPRVIELVADGLSASDIARQLNNEFQPVPELTRAAVLGRIWRYGLKLATPPGSRPKVGTFAKGKAKPSTSRAVQAVVSEATRQELLATPPLSIEEGGGRMTSGCHWPHGDPLDPDFTFCGRPRASQSPPYCEIHLKCMCQSLKQQSLTAAWANDPRRRVLASRRMLALKERVA